MLKKHFSIKIKFFLISILLLIPLIFVAAETVEELNSKLNQKQDNIGKIEKRIKEIETQIKQKQGEQITLKNQISILDAEIDKMSSEIQKTEAEIEKLDLEIEKLKNEINVKKQEIKKQKIVLGEYIRVINSYDQVSPIEIIFGYNSFSEFLDQLENLEKLENRGQTVLDNVQKLKEELEFKKSDVEKKSKDLVNLNNQLASERESLDDKKVGKENLLFATKDKEEEFKGLLAKAQKEQEAANQEIANIESEIRRQQESKTNNNDVWQDTGGREMAWPINPNQGISAYFMDPTYLTFWGINHYGIDIPAPQGTAMHAPADGYVAAYKDAGTGYSYIMIYHGGGISTVFGHASACYAAEGANVKRGDAIGASGGTPGSKGAGWMTTGPHLHFEVRVNGNPVDPMNYLP